MPHKLSRLLAIIVFVSSVAMPFHGARSAQGQESPEPVELSSIPERMRGTFECIRYVVDADGKEPVGENYDAKPRSFGPISADSVTLDGKKLEVDYIETEDETGVIMWFVGWPDSTYAVIKPADRFKWAFIIVDEEAGVRRIWALR